MTDRYTIIQQLLDSQDEGVFDINSLTDATDEELVETVIDVYHSHSPTPQQLTEITQRTMGSEYLAQNPKDMIVVIGRIADDVCG